MHATRPLIGSAAVALLALTACGSDSSDETAAVAPTTDRSDNSTVSASTVPAPELLRTIAVDATGSAQAVPDALTVSMGAEVLAPTVGEAMDRLTTASRALIDYLTSTGVAETDLRTETLNIYPQYSYGPDGMPGEVTAYSASTVLNVRIAEMAEASAVVDGAADAVGDAFRVNGVWWTITEAEALRADARSDAIESAGTQAEQLAAAAGLTVGAVREIHETASPLGYPGSEDMYGGGGGGIPFQGGTQSITVHVTVVYELNGS